MYPWTRENKAACAMWQVDEHWREGGRGFKLKCAPASCAARLRHPAPLRPNSLLRTTINPFPVSPAYSVSQWAGEWLHRECGCGVQGQSECLQGPPCNGSCDHVWAKRGQVPVTSETTTLLC